jgi:hypothetical protein
MRSVVFLSLLAFACGNDNGGPFGGDASTGDANTGCSVEANFSSLHDNLFSSTRCAIPGCHVSNPKQGDLDYTAGKAGVYDQLLNGGTFNDMADDEFPNRVEAGSSSTSYLYVKVSQDTPRGGGSGRMPPGAPLDDCEIAAIRKWIDDGAAND